MGNSSTVETTTIMSSIKIKKNSKIDWITKNFDTTNSQILGKGSYSEVFSAYSNNLKKEIAIKMIDKVVIKDMPSFTSEICLLEKLKSCSNIVYLEHFHIDTVDDYIILVMEKGYDNLRQMIINNNNSLKCGYILQIMADIAYGLSFAHNLGITHLDIKPANILSFLVDDRAQYPDLQKIYIFEPKLVFKLNDWGSGKFSSGNHETSLKSDIGYTPGFVAPEIEEKVIGKKVNLKKSDIYSFGMTILVCCGISFSELKYVNKLNKVKYEKDMKDILKRINHSLFKGLLTDMTLFDIDLRPDIESVIYRLKMLNRIQAETLKLEEEEEIKIQIQKQREYEEENMKNLEEKRIKEDEERLMKIRKDYEEKLRKYEEQKEQESLEKEKREKMKIIAEKKRKEEEEKLMRAKNDLEEKLKQEKLEKERIRLIELQEQREREREERERKDKMEKIMREKLDLEERLNREKIEKERIRMIELQKERERERHEERLRKIELEEREKREKQEKELQEQRNREIRDRKKITEKREREKIEIERERRNRDEEEAKRRAIERERQEIEFQFEREHKIKKYKEIKIVKQLTEILKKNNWNIPDSDELIASVNENIYFSSKIALIYFPQVKLIAYGKYIQIIVEIAAKLQRLSYGRIVNITQSTVEERFEDDNISEKSICVRFTLQRLDNYLQRMGKEFKLYDQ